MNIASFFLLYYLCFSFFFFLLSFVFWSFSRLFALLASLFFLLFSLLSLPSSLFSPLSPLFYLLSSHFSFLPFLFFAHRGGVSPLGRSGWTRRRGGWKENKNRSIFPKWLWLQSGGHFWGPQGTQARPGGP